MDAPILLFSHGFGVQKDDRGLFTDIAAAFPHYTAVMFDYNSVAADGKSLVARPFSQQVKMLRAQADTLRHHASPNSPLTLVCHSQGCVTAALAALSGITRTIFLTPPDSLEVDAFAARWLTRPGTKVNLQGESTLVRSDGSVTQVGADVWQQMREVAPRLPDLFTQLAQRTDLHIFSASHDEVLGPTDFSKLAGKAKLTTLAADHNFSGLARASLMTALRVIL
jgi:hypothetical protein